MLSDREKAIRLEKRYNYYDKRYKEATIPEVKIIFWTVVCELGYILGADKAAPIDEILMYLKE